MKLENAFLIAMAVKWIAASTVIAVAVWVTKSAWPLVILLFVGEGSCSFGDGSKEKTAPEGVDK